MQEWEETVQGGSYLMNETTPSLPIVETLWDDVLLSCLEPGGERMTLFKIEDTFIHFLKSKEQQLVIEQLPSYHRLLVHRYADRCGVERKQNDVGKKDFYLFTISNLFFVATCSRGIFNITQYSFI